MDEIQEKGRDFKLDDFTAFTIELFRYWVDIGGSDVYLVDNYEMKKLYTVCKAQYGQVWHSALRILNHNRLPAIR